NLEVPPADQLTVAGNACGPAALLTAFRTGNAHWQRAAAAVPGANDGARLRSMIHTLGRRESSHLPGRARWSKNGISVADLSDMANEMTAGQFLPRLDHEILFLQPRETPEQLLRRTHRRLEASLAKGFPPVVS